MASSGKPTPSAPQWEQPPPLPPGLFELAALLNAQLNQQGGPDGQ